MSREVAQIEALSKALAVYRMVFGLPRQDDLLRYLIAKIGEEQLSAMLAGCRMDLSPRSG